MARILHHLSKPIAVSYPIFNHEPETILHRFSFSHKRPSTKFSSFPRGSRPLILRSSCTPYDSISLSISDSLADGSVVGSNEFSGEGEVQESREKGTEKNFWGAVGLIVGTAVGPGMLGLPAATIRSGSFISTTAIVLCWVYVISSIILVAELSFAAMKEDEVAEVSFTSLAIKALGSNFGALVAVVYASLSFSLLVACVSGIGSVVLQWFPWMNVVLAHASFPLAAGIIIGFFPFKAIDTVNRYLCFFMLVSITSLVGIGLSVARKDVVGSFAPTSWNILSILPAIPVAVLTLGFHVITPFICKIAGDTVHEARKAILIGGVVPLIMVLSWNLIVLGLAGASNAVSTNDPISLLLSVNPSALSAVQGFAFAALATSLVGYAVSFPKQLLDTLELIFTKTNSEEQVFSEWKMFSEGKTNAKVGLATFSGGCGFGNMGISSFNGSRYSITSEIELPSNTSGSYSSHQKFIMTLVLGVPIHIGSFFPSTFSRALDFAGIYANCFLFGILPPAMAYIQQSRKKLRPSILPGGDLTLLLLFSIAVILGIWH